jgi:hypothetical protein
LKKLMSVSVLLALVLVAVVPAIAQVSNELGQESESDDVALGFDVANEGDYASQCTPAIQFGNTGNFNNGSSFVQYSGVADDFEPGGIEVAFEPSSEVECPSTIQQSSAASSAPPSQPPSGLPDLVPTSLNDCGLTARITNQGTAPAGASTTTVTFPPSFGSTTQPTPPLGVGESFEFTVPIPGPAFDPDAEWEIAADATAQVPESEEGNNVAFGLCLG